MTVYTVPALNAVDFGLVSVTPESVVNHPMALVAYSAPSLSAVDFELSAYALPTFSGIDFELFDEPEEPEPEVEAQGQQPAGKPRRYYVEIDGNHFPVESVEHARALLERATEVSVKSAERDVSQVKTVRSLGLVERPKITTNAPVNLAPYVEAIDRNYERALIAAEIRLLLQIQQDQEDDEAAAYLLLT